MKFFTGLMIAALGCPLPSQAQFKPITHALRVTFDLKPQNPVQAVLDGSRWAMAGWDFRTTQDFLGNGSCTESNPLLGQHPSTGRLLGVGIPLELGLTRLDNYLQKHLTNKDDRIAATVIVNVPATIIHGAMAYHNMEFCNYRPTSVQPKPPVTNSHPITN